MSITLGSIHIYPIKSLGGIRLSEARLTDRGLEYDRRWMLVDRDGRFLTQRELPTMACLHCEINADGFDVLDTRTGERLSMPWTLEGGNRAVVEIWGDQVESETCPAEWSTWFANRLGHDVKLRYMPDRSHRPVDTRYAHGITALSDGFPYLIISQASLDDLNQKLETPVPMDRFRPNLVITGGHAYQEDDWTEIGLGSARFQLVKPCGRCAITTTDQRTGERSKEPLRTLSTYRARDGKVLFGMNAMGQGGMVHVGDLVAP